MSMSFAYMAGGEEVCVCVGGGGLEVFKCFIRGVIIFSACFVCGGEGVRFSTSPSVKKITDPLVLINDLYL